MKGEGCRVKGVGCRVHGVVARDAQKGDDRAADGSKSQSATHDLMVLNKWN